jgi:predicted DNA-binding transcriptional regulator AlpA
MSKADMTPLEPLLSIGELAETLRVSRRSVERMRSAGKLPKPDLHVGKMPRWTAAVLRQWIADQSAKN